MGWDERSKAAVQINHSVLQWERRQEISLEHYNHTAPPLYAEQTRLVGGCAGFLMEILATKMHLIMIAELWDSTDS